LDFIKAMQDKLESNIPFNIMDDAFTFIIGLGGSGMKFAGETKDLLLEKYGETKVNDRVKFICIDTSCDKPKNMTDKEFIMLDGLKDDQWINGWLNQELIKKRQEGELRENYPATGGNRMIGRWRLFSSLPIINQNFSNILINFFGQSGFLNIKHIYVIVMASICGGTGSGSFIDIPYIIRKTLINNALDHRKIEIYGMLDASYIDNSTFYHTEKEVFRANVYAAMKELKYFMCDDTEYTAQFQEEDYIYKTNEHVFNKFFLFSHNTVTKDGCDYKVMEECKKEYDKIKNIKVGLHIAEGSQDDIRCKLKELAV